MLATRLEGQRLCLTLRGAVQGVGFRPFAYRLAVELGLAGWVTNSAQGVALELEGAPAQLVAFRDRLQRELPAPGHIHSLTETWRSPVGYQGFEIRASVGGEKSAWVLPDLAPCAACLRELFDPSNRRYRYPLLNCTHCGPRYTIVRALPYDRPQTAMRDFPLCHCCQQEYDNPGDRRFHAQPNACPDCGPRLSFWDESGHEQPGDPLVATLQALQAGHVVAVKGLGGFHLLVLARSEAAVQQLRARKGRPAKPLAVMYPDLEAIAQDCQLGPLEADFLQSPAAPIVLLPRRATARVATAVAPGNPTLGVMLPSTPLHHLLLADLGQPVVATSGNRSGEPLCITEPEARQRLAGIADGFLVHDRPIVRPVDDSLVRVVAERPLVLRCARGYSPLPLPGLPASAASPAPVLAVGAQLKSSIAIALRGQAFLSQHLGDLENAATLANFHQAIASFQTLYDFQPECIACDAHPDYLASRYAQSTGLPLVTVQHHYAHVLAVMGEQGLLGQPVLGVAWDGTGYGLDGTIWGGEFLAIAPQAQHWRRVAHLRPLLLPGGDRASREPRRAALGLLYGAFGPDLFARADCQDWLARAFTPQEQRLLAAMVQRGVNAPRTSSIGRLFDAFASLLGGCDRASFEGQAAMQWEFAIADRKTAAAYSLPLVPPPSPELPWQLDWQPLLEQALAEQAAGVAVGDIAAKFHNALMDGLVAIAQTIGLERVVLTGGCFQNRYLLTGAIARLRAAGFQPAWPQQVPLNDGGIAYGQLLAALLAQGPLSSDPPASP